MIIIKDYKAIYEYRIRRQERLDGKRLDDEWKTIKGTHVMVDDDGQITKGPENLRGLSKKSELKIGKEMSPINSDYVYDEGDDEQDFTHKNIKKLKPIYDEHGLSACHDEWYKFRLADSTKDIHPISKDEADEVMYDNVRQSIYDGWFRNADSSYKPQLTDAVIKNPEMRNASLNLAYENYRNSVDKPLSFEEFLVTPIKMYRGENGQRHLEDDVFDAYTFDRKIAEHFASKPGRGESKVIEIEVRPIDTYGSMRAVGEAEIWIPRQLSPVGYKEDQKDPRMDGVDWEIYNPIKFILEDFVEVVEEDDGNDELIDSIMQEAETIKLFSDKNNEVSKSMVSRCADSIQRTILQLMLKMLPSNEDSAFFAGELNENIGERNIQYPEVEAFKERRKKRLDDKDDEGRWITTENNHKVHLNEEGEPDKGNPKVVAVMESGGGVARVASRIAFKKSSLGAEEIKKYNSKFEHLAERMTEANKRVKEEEKKLNEKWKGVPYRRRPNSAWDNVHKEMKVQREIEKELFDAFSELPVGVLLSKKGMLYEKVDGGWIVKDARKDLGYGSPISEKAALAGLAGKDDLSVVKPVRCIDTTDSAEMVRPIEVKSNEAYKSFAETINKGDKKAVVARAKKDPEFKELIDGITLYTQGAYGDQKKEARFLVKNGVEEALADTVGDYFGDGYYDMKQLWNGQKLAESNSSFSGGVLSMIGAINNAQPYEKELWRIADDRNILRESEKMGALYIPPKVGDRIKMDAPTSFTKEEAVLKDIGNTKYGDIIIYELEPGARALDIEQLSHYKSQKEAITCGEFEVVDVSVKNSRRTRMVKKDANPEVVESAKKRMIGVDEDGNYIVPFYEVRVKIRQVGKTDIGKREDSAVDYYVCDHFDGRIGFGDEITAYRERRQKRLDAKENDEEWITIKGTHVLVDENGEAKSGGKLKGMTFRDAKPQKRKESASKPESVPDKVAYSGSTAKRDFNKKIEDIIKSSDDESIKIFNTVKMLDNLPKGTRIDFPDSWTSDDGTKNYGIYEGNGIWKVRYGRKKDETYTLSNEGMAGYMLYEDENERAKITKVPEDEAIKEKRAREKGTAKHYAMNPDGSINGKHTNDFHNEHVSQEERDKFSKDIKEIAFAERGFDDSRSLYRGEANKVGDKVEEEIRRRAALRKKDKENAPINDRPQVEDIYDVLRDCRDFGMPDGFKPDVHSDLSPEKTEEIIKEAFDRYPTDWLKDAKYTPVITIVDGPGRPICTNGRFITLYTKRNLGDSVVEQNDRALVNDLAHELGHYMEDANKKVGDSVKDCLWSRGAGTEIVDVEPGYQGYKDSFFRTYMGKIYSHGGTEVLSMLMEYIGAFSPMEILSGQEYDVMKGKYGRKKNDKESLGYILGVLAGL